MEELIQLGCWQTSTMKFRSPDGLMECMDKESKGLEFHKLGSLGEIIVAGRCM
jgi:hypothetical protein